MTEKAREIGLTGSTFANSTGLDAPEHLMTVRDLALLARRIVADFPDYFKYYGEREFEYAGIKQPNRNPLLQAGVPGVDGMKTGFTDGSGYGLVATAKRDDRRMITVLAGLDIGGPAPDRGRAAAGVRLSRVPGVRSVRARRARRRGRRLAGRRPQGAAGRPGDGRDHPLARGAQGAGRQAGLRQPGARAGRCRPGSWAAPRSRRPGMAPMTVPLVAAGDVARAGMLGRATGSLSYLIWGAPAT